MSELLSNSFESLTNEIIPNTPQKFNEIIMKNDKNDLGNSTSSLDSSPVLIVTAGYDHTIRFWDVLQGTCLATLQHNESQVNCLTISPDKKFLAVGGNPNVRIFDIEETLNLAILTSTTSPNLQDFSASTANLQAKNILQGHTSNITSIAFQSASQWLFTASTDGTVRIWDFPGLKFQKEFKNKSAINGAVLHPNQAEILIGDEGGCVRVLDLITSTFTVEMFPEDNVPVTCVAISEDGEQLAMVNENGNLYVWLSKTAQTASNSFTPLASVKSAHKPHATKCFFSPNSQMLVTMGSDGLVKKWSIDVDLKKINLSSNLTEHENWIWDAAFSADSSFILTGSSDNTARLWDVGAGEVICIYSGHMKAVTAVAMNDSVIIPAKDDEIN